MRKELTNIIKKNWTAIPIIASIAAVYFAVGDSGYEAYKMYKNLSPENITMANLFKDALIVTFGCVGTGLSYKFYEHKKRDL